MRLFLVAELCSLLVPFTQELTRELEEKQDIFCSLQDTAELLSLENHPAKQTVEVSKHEEELGEAPRTSPRTGTFTVPPSPGQLGLRKCFMVVEKHQCSAGAVLFWARGHAQTTLTSY